MKSPPSPMAAADPERRRLVLLVDDCSDSREMYAEYLSEEFAIAEASSGVEAIDQALALLPDVVVMDLALPGMNGTEASIRLKRDPRTRQIPLLVVSGQREPEPSSPNDINPIWDAFLVKPCRPSVLADQIRRTLANTPATPPVAAPDRN